MTWRRSVALVCLSGAVAAIFAVVAAGQQPGPSFGDPLPGLPQQLLARFDEGKDHFEEEETVEEGLGPVFNDRSCAACHSVGGTGGGSNTFVTRFGRLSYGIFVPLEQLGGSLIQSQGIGQYGNYNYKPEVVPPQANVVAKRRTTPLFGLGLVDAVPDQTFVQIMVQEQYQTPLTAGVAPIIQDIASGRMRVGKFGWKCQVATLATFSGDAYLNEMGITTPMFPEENYPQGNMAMLAGNPVQRIPNDEDNSALEQLTDFMTMLGPPPPPAPVSAELRGGDQVFMAIGCANCHRPTLQTGPNVVRSLDRVVFQPFSDFLLHDMGTLGDGIVQGKANGRMMRTAPLWGLRLTTRFLHDGRATNISDAIRAHDGQGRDSATRFVYLDAKRKAQLLAFLGSL